MGDHLAENDQLHSRNISLKTSFSRDLFHQLDDIYNNTRFPFLSQRLMPAEKRGKLFRMNNVVGRFHLDGFALALLVVGVINSIQL